MTVKEMSELQQITYKIDSISGIRSTEVEVVKLLRLIATEQAKIIDLLKQTTKG